LLRIFNALLRIARIESMAPGEVMERTDINNLINEVSELYEPLVEDEGGILETQVSGGLEAICQKDLVFQGLVNLIENALKYGRPKDGEFRIRISASEHEGRVVLNVSDTGPGIPEKDQDRVKDRFVRLDESRSEPGTGLGLSLVKAVARLHGGELQLTNGDPGLVARIDLTRAKPGSSGSSNGHGGKSDGANPKPE
jgi:signal transduction histidine kinase